MKDEYVGCGGAALLMITKRRIELKCPAIKGIELGAQRDGEGEGDGPNFQP